MAKAKQTAAESAANSALVVVPRPRSCDAPEAWARTREPGKWREYYGYRYRPDAGPEKHLNPTGPAAKFPGAAIAAALIAHSERGGVLAREDAPGTAAKATPSAPAPERKRERERERKAPAIQPQPPAASEYDRLANICAAALQEPVAPAYETHSVAYLDRSKPAFARPDHSQTAEEADAKTHARERMAVALACAECGAIPGDEGGAHEATCPRNAATVADTKAFYAAEGERVIAALDAAEPEDTRTWEQAARDHERAKRGPARVTHEMPAEHYAEQRRVQEEAAQAAGWRAPAADGNRYATAEQVLREMAAAYGPRRAHKLLAMADFVAAHGKQA